MQRWFTELYHDAKAECYGCAFNANAGDAADRCTCRSPSNQPRSAPPSTQDAFPPEMSPQSGESADGELCACSFGDLMCCVAWL